jgi:hypothetical protein
MPSFLTIVDKTKDNNDKLKYSSSLQKKKMIPKVPRNKYKGYDPAEIRLIKKTLLNKIAAVVEKI